MQNPDNGDREVGWEAEGEGFRTQAAMPASRPTHAPVIHLLENERGQEIWCDCSVMPALQPEVILEQCSRCHQLQPAAAAVGSAATSLQTPHPVGRGAEGAL